MLKNFLFLWRGELLTVVSLVLSWLAFRKLFNRPFWRFWTPGALLGLTIEVITEPEWTYHLQAYLYRDVSLAVIAGWGIMFSWLVFLSDLCYDRWFNSAAPGSRPGVRVMLTDTLVGVPLLLSNELFGLHVLKIWQYNDILHWDTMIPVIQYPAEGLGALVLYVVTVPAIIRWWKGY
ncbi:MAG: hypothetical protein HGA76_08150 [Candidatus Firestonebacteria bacterium]|nr:hypothetical protein [Candidatus Firestonebacteria bacterium]